MLMILWVFYWENKLEDIDISVDDYNRRSVWMGKVRIIKFQQF